MFQTLCNHSCLYCFSFICLLIHLVLSLLTRLTLSIFSLLTPLSLCLISSFSFCFSIPSISTSMSLHPSRQLLFLYNPSQVTTVTFSHVVTLTLSCHVSVHRYHKTHRAVASTLFRSNATSSHSTLDRAHETAICRNSPIHNFKEVKNNVTDH